MRNPSPWVAVPVVALALATVPCLLARAEDGAGPKQASKENPGAKAPAQGGAADLAARITKLIAQLGDDDYATRQRAQEQLSEIGADAFDALAEAQNHDDPEIAARSRYLLRSIRIEFTRESDSPVLRQQLKNYPALAPLERLARIKSLAAVTDAAAVGALCRIARYEQAEPLAKHAAVAVIGQKLLPGVDEKQRGQQILDALGSSQR